jgi:hypothetical protein
MNDNPVTENDNPVTDAGQSATETSDETGRRMAVEAQREIVRRGLENVLRAHYAVNQHTVRLDRIGPWGDSVPGIEYPAYPVYLSMLLEHVGVLARSWKT